MQRAAVAGRLQPLHAHETTHTASSALMGGVRQVRSTLILICPLGKILLVVRIKYPAEILNEKEHGELIEALKRQSAG